jgi:hypothetical protein
LRPRDIPGATPVSGSVKNQSQSLRLSSYALRVGRSKLAPSTAMSAAAPLRRLKYRQVLVLATSSEPSGKLLELIELATRRSNGECRRLGPSDKERELATVALRSRERPPSSIVLRPEIRRDYPLNLSISISGGKETNKDSPSNGERSGNSPAPNPSHLMRRDLWC